MQSSENFKPNQAKGVLILGQAGTGKTTLAASLPGSYILDCDNNLSGAVRYLKEQKLPPFKYDSVPIDEQGNPVDPQQCFERASKFLLEASKDTSTKFNTIDSLSTFADFVLDEILKQQGRSVLQLQDWGTFQRVLARTFMRGRSSTKTFIVTAHVETEKDEVSGIVKYFPLLAGKMQKKIGLYFSDVWLCEVDEKKGYTVRTQANVWHSLKNSFGFPAVIDQETARKALSQ